MFEVDAAITVMQGASLLNCIWWRQLPPET